MPNEYNRETYIVTTGDGKRYFGMLDVLYSRDWTDDVGDWHAEVTDHDRRIIGIFRADFIVSIVRQDAEQLFASDGQPVGYQFWRAARPPHQSPAD